MLINQPIPDNVYRSNDMNKILISALESVDPNQCVKKVLKRKRNSLFIKNQEIDLQKVNRIFVIRRGQGSSSDGFGCN